MKVDGSHAVNVQPVRSLPAMGTVNSSVAGIALMDSRVAGAATELARDVYPPVLFNHCVRAWLFGSLIGEARGEEFDPETLYLACLLHDLGLTARFEGDLPFEIEGAEAARRFLMNQNISTEQAELVWDGIALHAMAIGQFKRPEIALVREGVRIDVLGSGPNEIAGERIAAVVAAYPRLAFKTSFLSICADVVRRHPAAATRGFMRDIGERFVSDFRPANFCDLVDKAPFSE